jgi:hypothetical protein
MSIFLGKTKLDSSSLSTAPKQCGDEYSSATMRKPVWCLVIQSEEMFEQVKLALVTILVFW